VEEEKKSSKSRATVNHSSGGYGRERGGILKENLQSRQESLDPLITPITDKKTGRKKKKKSWRISSCIKKVRVNLVNSRERTKKGQSTDHFKATTTHGGRPASAAIRRIMKKVKGKKQGKKEIQSRVMTRGLGKGAKKRRGNRENRLLVGKRHDAGGGIKVGEVHSAR